MTDRRSELRSARHRRDGIAVVAALAGRDGLDEVLQLAGDGLQAALGQHVHGADRLAAACMEGLRRRGWTGDDLLADQLAAALGLGPVPMLRRLTVDLDELSGILEGDPVDGRGRVDRHTGEVWHARAVEYARETGEEDDTVTEDPDRWLWVESEGSRGSYRDMETFMPPSRAPPVATASTPHSEGGGRSGDSRTPSQGGPTSSSAGTGGPRNNVWVEPGSGSPAPDTHRVDPTEDCTSFTYSTSNEPVIGLDQRPTDRSVGSL